MRHHCGFLFIFLILLFFSCSACAEKGLERFKIVIIIFLCKNVIQDVDISQRFRYL